MRGDASGSSAISVLLVENDPEQASRLRAMLSSWEIERFGIVEAATVEDALLMLREGSFDAVLLDLSLSEGSDLDLFMRARIAAVDSPIVVLGPESGDDAILVLRAGAQEYLSRAECSPRLLARTICQAVERHRIRAELRAARQRDHFNATHDPLTGHANREAFLEQLSAAVAHAERTGKGLAVLFIDLDHFKSINDSLGHSAGDQLLKFVAERLSMGTRQSDLVARFAGDEFVLFLRDVRSPQALATVAQNLLQTLSEPYLLEGHESWVTASIGVAVHPDDGRHPNELLRNSDMAMYRAKLNGRNNFQFCTESMNAAATRRLLIRNGLARALEEERLSLEYQPIREIGSGRLTGTEALIRWQDPEARDVPPDEFIPIAEDTGLIVPIGEWVLRRACQQARRWQEQGFDPIRLSVNVSPRQLRQHTLVGTIREILEEAGLSPGWLELEITESALVQGDSYTQSALKNLNEMGVSLAVDDFGTGYSALSYLRKFRFDRVKVDRSFIENVPHDPDAAALATAVIAMTRSLKLGSLVEGVETEAQATFLREQGCDEIQGFLVGPSVPHGEFVRFLERVKGDTPQEPDPGLA